MIMIALGHCNVFLIPTSVSIIFDYARLRVLKAIALIFRSSHLQ